MADDDIIELVDVVKPGQGFASASGSASAAKPAQRAAASGTPDFGADLDALLNDFGSNAASSAAAAPASGLENNGALPDHDVNPNEELDLPPLSDLDALLEELGVPDVAPQEAAPARLELDDLDAAPLPGSTAPAAAPSAPVAAPAAQAPASTPVAAPAPSAPAAPAAHAAQQAGDPTDGIDMNELDALLDSVLASAPKAPAKKAPDAAAQPAPAAAPASSAAPVAPDELDAVIASADLDEFLEMSAAAAGGLSVGEAAELVSLRQEVETLRGELADLRANMAKHAAAAAAKVIREEIVALSDKL